MSGKCTGVRSERSADLCAWKLHRKVTLDKEVPGVLGLPLLEQEEESSNILLTTVQAMGESASVLVLKGESAHLSNLSV